MLPMRPAKWSRARSGTPDVAAVPLTDLKIEVADTQAGRLDRVVQEMIQRSRAATRGLFDHDCVSLNGAVCTEPGTQVNPGDHVAVRYEPHTNYREKPRIRENSAFRLVFDDDWLIVVEKPAGVLTVPTDRGESNTLLDAINHQLSRGRRAHAAVVQRLDRETSGLLVFGKDVRTGRDLREQFQIHKAEREYVAIVAGVIDRPSGTFSSQLATTKSLRRYSLSPDQRRTQREKTKRRRDDEGESAITHFRVERRLRTATYVRVRLETGRRNQIRVHFAEAGHPVLGDDRYRADLAQHPAWNHRRLALHAAVLGFEHPRTRQRLYFESPLPAEFERFLAGPPGSGG